MQQGMTAADGPRDMQAESAMAPASDGREQVSRARRASQAGASSAGGSDKAECGARCPDGRPPAWKHYRFYNRLIIFWGLIVIKTFRDAKKRHYKFIYSRDMQFCINKNIYLYF